jgi:hypothetical protein
MAEWVRRETDLTPAQVVDVSASAVTGIVSALPTGARRGFSAVIRTQSLDPEFIAKEGVLAWTMAVDLDCATRRIRLGEMTGYAARTGRQGPRTMRPAQDIWLSPSAGAPLDHVWSALCDRQYQRPLTGMRKIADRTPDPVAPPETPPRRESKPPPQQPMPVSASKVSPAASTGAGVASVQVGTAGSEADAKALLAKLNRKFAKDLGGLKPGVVRATVDGKTIYRAMLTGFPAPKAASQLCETLKTAGQACFVRRAASAD